MNRQPMSDLSHTSVAETPRDRVREARRLALLEAAEQVFAEKGYGGAHMSEIAARAGYSAGSLYNSFDGKEDLFRAVVEWRGQEALARIRGALDETEHAPVAEMLHRFVEAAFAFWSEHPHFFRIYEDVTHGLDWNEDRLGPDGGSMRGELEARFEARLARALGRGELADGDPALYAALVFGTLNRAIARCMSCEEDREAAETLSRQTIAVLLRALGVAS